MNEVYRSYSVHVISAWRTNTVSLLTVTCGMPPKRSTILQCSKNLKEETAIEPGSHSDALSQDQSAISRFAAGIRSNRMISASRRFRNTLLRKPDVPDGLIQFWMGHERKNMTDVYDNCRDDLEYRAGCRKESVWDLNCVGTKADICTDVPKPRFQLCLQGT